MTRRFVHVVAQWCVCGKRWTSETPGSRLCVLCEGEMELEILIFRNQLDRKGL